MVQLRRVGTVVRAGLVVVVLALMCDTARAAAIPADGTPVALDGQRLRAALLLVIENDRLSDPARACETLPLDAILLERYRGAATDSATPQQVASELAGLRSAYRSARGIDACERRPLGEGILDLLVFAEGSTTLSAGTRAAVRRVARQALELSSATGNGVGDRGLSPLTDLSESATRTTLAPGPTVTAAIALAATNAGYAQARDLLSDGETGVSVTADVATLVEHPTIQAAGIDDLVTPATGRLTSTYGAVMSRVDAAVARLDDARDATLADIVAVDDGTMTPDTATTAAAGREAGVAADAGVLEFMAAVLDGAAAAGGAAATGLAEAGGRVLAVRAAVAGATRAFVAQVGAEVRRVAGALVAPFGKGGRGILASLGRGVLILAGRLPTARDQRLLDAIQSVRDDIAALRTEMNARFDAVDAKLDAIYTEMVARFDELSDKLDRLDEGLRTVRDEVEKLSAQVERLERNVYGLFRDSQNRELWTQINTAIGYRERSVGGTPMSNAQFLEAEGFFYTWATVSAYDSIAVGPPDRPVDEPSIEAQLATIPLEGNLPYLSSLGVARFGLAPLSSSALPNIRDFAVAARAYSALLVENPEYVTTGVRARLAAILDRGRAITAALARLGVRDAPGTGTGSRAFNGALDMYRRAGTAAAANGVHSVTSALAEVEGAYLATLVTPRGNPLGLDLWGAVDQPGPALDSDTPQTFEVCGDPGPFSVGLTTPSTMSRSLAFSPLVRNALRLGVREGRVVCEVTATNLRATDEAFSRHTADFTVVFRTEVRTSAVGVWSPVLTRSKTFPDVMWCEGSRTSDTCATIDPLAEAAERWESTFAFPAPWKTQFEQSATTTTPRILSLERDVDGALTDRQKGLYAHVLDRLTAPPLLDPLRRLTGAKGVLEAYVEFGLWRDLEEDGTLRGLLYGEGGLLARGPQDLLGEEYRAALTAPPATNVRHRVASLIASRATEFEAVLGQTLVAAEAPPAKLAAERTGLRSHPLVESTNARLLLTGVLPGVTTTPPPDPVDPGPVDPGPTGPTPPAPGPAPTPAPPAPLPAPPPAPAAPAPTPVTPQGPGSTPAPPTLVSRVSVKAPRIGQIRRRGVAVALRAARAGKLTVRLTVSAATARRFKLGSLRTLATTRRTVKKAGTVRLRLKPGVATARRLARLSRIPVTVRIRLVAPGRPTREATRTVTLRR